VISITNRQFEAVLVLYLLITSGEIWSHVYRLSIIGSWLAVLRNGFLVGIRQELLFFVVV
jgi:hypothetical protein